MVSGAKNPVFVEAGKRGARKRWGPEPRVVRLDELSTEQRAVVRAFIAMVAAPHTEMAAAWTGDVSATATSEVRGDRLDVPTE